jgi:TfoX/Sxy family transcriptional regulator of competence genes
LTPEERYSELVATFTTMPRVSEGSLEPGARNRFGSSGLKVNGKIFAMLVRGNLVLKLPRKRVDALVAAGEGEPFDPRRNGRAMREWLVLDAGSRLEWAALAREAFDFVAAKS